MQLKTILCPIDFSEFSAAAYQHALSLAEHSFAQKENMEVIVMGTHGRRGFDHLVQGSTADRIMRKAACPVLVVPNTSQKAGHWTRRAPSFGPNPLLHEFFE